jgi:hypothetical protein
MDWELLTQLENQSDSDEDDGVLDLNYKAWRWLGERSPWASYLVAQPKFSFVRLGNDIRICWDNRRKKVDDIPVWTAEFGMHTMSVKAFQEECASFKDRLLTTMEQRIIEIESGAATPLVSIDTQSLRRQHEEWRVELSAYFGSYTPDIGWPDCETALSAVAANKGINL